MGNMRGTRGQIDEGCRMTTKSVNGKPVYRRPWIWMAIGLTVAGVIYCVAQPTAERIAAHQSGTNISLVGSILVEEKPDIFDRESVKMALEKYKHDETVLLDGWGNPLVLYVSNTTPPSYLVMSYGRDGVRGGCCEKFVDSLDSDLVWRDGSWLQVYTSDSH